MPLKLLLSKTSTHSPTGSKVKKVRPRLTSKRLLPKLKSLPLELGYQPNTATLLQNAKLPSRNTDSLLLRLLPVLPSLQLALYKKCHHAQMAIACSSKKCHHAQMATACSSKKCHHAQMVIAVSISSKKCHHAQMVIVVSISSKKCHHAQMVIAVSTSSKTCHHAQMVTACS